MNAFMQTWRVACYEWFDALRSRRALVVLLLYLAAAVCNMHWSINLLHKLESELATALQLPASEQAGVVSTALWKSKPFQRMMKKMTQNDLVLRDITGKHPLRTICWFAFLLFAGRAGCRQPHRPGDRFRLGAPSDFPHLAPVGRSGNSSGKR